MTGATAELELKSPVSGDFYMKKTAYFGAALLGLAALGQAGAHAGLVNAGFETGDLTGWTATYDPRQDAPWLGPLVAVGTSGSIYSGTYSATLIAGILAYSPTILSQTFLLSAGETVNGAADFIPEPQDDRFNDFSSVTINGVTLFSADIATQLPLGDGATGWVPYSFTAPSAGWYTLTASVTNVNGGPSQLRLDAVVPEPSTSAVPEPSTWAMMLVGFAGLGFAGYRRATLTV
jgi:PEP-CTERM motif